jgi:hypothetical protein
MEIKYKALCIDKYRVCIDYPTNFVIVSSTGGQNLYNYHLWAVQ